MKPQPQTVLDTSLGNFENIEVTRLLNMMYIDMEQQIGRADTKSQIILSANAILIAIFANFGLGIEHIGSGGSALNSIVVISLTITILLALVVSVYFALSATMPRVGTAKDDLNLLYSKHIANLTPEAYIDTFLGMTVQDLKRSVLHQIHAKAGIVERKFKYVQRSIVFIFLAITLWAALELLVLIP